MPDVRVGVIGTSQHTEENHIRNLKSHARAEIVAVCGRNQERARAVAERNGIPRTFANYRTMITDGGLDAVVISTPDDTHYPMAMAALEAGLHVLCEKPLASTAAQAREMYQAAEAAGVIHMTYFNWRWVPHHRQMLALLRDEYIGQPFNLSMRWWLDIGKQAGYLWRLDSKRGGGVLADLGAHMIDLARLYMGDVTRVMAQLNTYRSLLGQGNKLPDPANDTTNLLLEFAGGGQAAIQLSFLAYQGEDDSFGDMATLLHGSQGTMRTVFNLKDITLSGACRGEASLHPLPVDEQFWEASGPAENLPERYFNLLTTSPMGNRLFIESILGEGRPDATFYDGWKVQQVIDAALESGRQGAWVAVR